MKVARVIVALGFASLATLAGCAAETGDGIDSQENAETSESQVTATVGVLGTIKNGETKKAVYSQPPTYRAYRFSAKGGDKITVDVVSPDESGDPIAWITNTNYTAYAVNDDASADTFNSKVVYEVPAGTPNRNYMIVFRDYAGYKAAFEVTLNIASAEPPCDPEHEPNRNYIGTPKTCPTIRYTCQAGTRSFANECGCGCTRE